MVKSAAASDMAKSKRSKPASKQELIQRSPPPIRDDIDEAVDEQQALDLESEEDEDDEDESEVEIRVGGAQEKDDDEEELERLVFGDSAGFREALRDDGEGVGFDEDQGEGRTGLEGLDDAQLFFTDLTPGQDLHKQAIATVPDEDSDDATLGSRQPPAWEDSDDERTLVSLASVPRLRKLRKTEVEDVVNGREYARRLRKQFELLNPVPEWAQSATKASSRKRRKLSTSDASSDEDVSADEMDLDDDTPSAPPLLELLQDADSLTRASGLGTGNKRKIRPEVIDIQRQKDIASIQPSAVTSLSFHPRLPLLLSSGPSATLYLHQLASSPPAPSPNPLLTSLHIRGSELNTTAFHPKDSRIFLSARRRYFHVWNLTTGRVEKITRVYGQQHSQRTMERFKLSPDGSYMALLGSTKKGGGVVNVLDATTLQYATQVRIESRGGIAEFAWWRNSKGLCVAGKNGEITEWNLAEQRVIARWQDEGAVGTTTLALGGQHELVKSPIGTDRWIAIGSSSGIINIYDRRIWLNGNARSTESQPVPEQPKPTKMLDHLTTPTSHLVFSPDGQILAMASKWKRDSMRLVHLPSCTVFKNWPTSSTPLGRITGVAFARGDVVEGSDTHSVLAVANEQGKIRLWEIR